MIKLQTTTQAHHAALAYRLNEAQAAFSASPDSWFDIKGGKHRCVTIFQDNEIVGFFVLDTGTNRADYSDNANAVLLRSMSVLPAYQGKGIARAALAPKVLDCFVRRHFAHVDEIILGVNHANRAAISLYQKVGFIDTGRTYMGIKGVQYIFCRRLAE